MGHISRPRSFNLVCCAAALLLLEIGCGYTGDVLPPSLNIPEAVRDLSVSQTGDKLNLQFTLPVETTDFVTIDRFREVDLRIGDTVIPFNFVRWSERAKRIPIVAPDLTVDNNPDAEEAERRIIRQTLPASDWEGKHLAISVRTSTKEDRYSPWSNVVRLNVQAALEKPVIESLSDTAQGLRVAWRIPEEGSVEGISWHILRQRLGLEKESHEVGTSDKPEFIDSGAADGGTYRYQLVAYRQDGQSTSASPVSDFKDHKFDDHFAPTIPSTLTALVGVKSIELSWERSPEPDTKGYHLFRAEGKGELKRIGELLALPSYSDRDLKPDTEYHYAISAIDQKGNESKQSKAVDAEF